MESGEGAGSWECVESGWLCGGGGHAAGCRRVELGMLTVADRMVA